MKRIGIRMPYQPNGDGEVARLFPDYGYDVVAVHGLERPSGVRIAHATEDAIRNGPKALAAMGVEAIIRAGTHLAAADLAAVDLADEAGRWLELPVLAIDAVTCWRALRQC